MDFVKDVMTKNPTCCSLEDNLEQVAKMMLDCDCGEIPIVDENKKVLGVITDRDICCRTIALGKNPLEMKARDCMSSPAITVPAEMSAYDCCAVMENRAIRRVPVVDKEGAICGMISLADIARHEGEGMTYQVVREVSKPKEFKSVQ